MTATSPSDGTADSRGAVGATDPTPRRRRPSVLGDLDPSRAARRHQASRPTGWRPSSGGSPAGRGRAAHADRRSVAAPAEASPEDDERWSREWMATRRRQRRARAGVGLGLVIAAGCTVLALLTTGSPQGSGVQAPVVLTPGPASVGPAGLVPVPQSPPTTP